METVTGKLQKFHSRPYNKRPAFVAAALALAISWILVFVWVTVALMHYSQDSVLGYFELLSVLGVVAVAMFMTFALIHEKNIEQELVIDDETLSLSTFDNNEHTAVIQSVDFKDVSSAEHFKAADTGAIVLHGKQEDLEIPTWCFDHEIDLMLVEKLRSENIPVIGVPCELEAELQQRPSEH